MSEYLTNSDSESPSEVSDVLEDRTSLGQENTGFEIQMPHDQIQETADINEAHQKLDFEKSSSLPRKLKNPLTWYQRSALEEFFKEKMYASSKDRSKLSAELGLPHLQVRNWFNYRRSKLKRKNGKSLSQDQVERPRSTDFNVDPQHVSNEFTPQDGPKGEGTSSHQHFVNDNFVGQKAQVLPETTSLGRTFGGHCYETNMFQGQYLQVLQQVCSMRQAQGGQRGVVLHQNNNAPIVPSVSFPQQVRPMRVPQDGPRGVVPYQNNNPTFVPAVSFPQQVRPMRVAQDGPRGVVPYQNNNPPFIPAVSFPQQVRPMRVSQDGPRNVVPYQNNNPPFVPAVSFPQQVRPMRVAQDGPRGVVQFQNNNPPFVPAVSFPQQVRPMRVARDGPRGIVLGSVSNFSEVPAQNQRQRG